MQKMLKVFIIVILVLFTQITLSSENTQPTSSSLMIVPDSSIQKQINSLFTLTPSVSKNEKELLNEIAKLKETNKSLEYVIQQLIYFRTNTMKMYNAKQITGQEMERAMGFAFVTIGKLLTIDENSRRFTSPSAQTLIRAVVPYLGTEDPDLKKQLREMLELVDYPENSRGKLILNYALPADYTEYRLFIESNKNNLSEPLVQYMYQKSPGDALLTLTQVYINGSTERDSIIQAENVIREDFRKRDFGPVETSHTVSAQARESLDQLSNKYPQWWIQMYIAEIILREPQFSSPQILERLKNTKHPLVLKTLEKTVEK